MFLAMFYCPHEEFAFLSVALIGWDLYDGAYLRALHANGASMFFLCAYLHMGKGVYYGGYLKTEV